MGWIMRKVLNVFGAVWGYCDFDPRVDVCWHSPSSRIPLPLFSACIYDISFQRQLHPLSLMDIDRVRVSGGDWWSWGSDRGGVRRG